MAKWQNDNMLDAALNYLKTAVTREVVCSDQPTTYDEAVTTYMLAIVTVDSGDFTLADGDTSGRKVTVAEQTSVSITNAGVGNHVALVSVGDTTLRYVTTCSDANMVAGGTCDIPAWEIEIYDAA